MTTMAAFTAGSSLDLGVRVASAPARPTLDRSTRAWTRAPLRRLPRAAGNSPARPCGPATVSRVAAERTERTNEQWLAELRSSARPIAEAALADLRALAAAAVRSATGASR